MLWASPAPLATRMSEGLFRLDAAVVFLAIDLTAGAILFVVDLRVFLAGEPASVGLTIGVDLLVNTLLAIFGAGGLAGGHLAAANAVGNAILLKLAARADFVVAVVGGVGVVLVVIDGVAEIVLLAVDLVAFLLGELAAIGGAVVVNFAIEIGFAAFDVLGFTGGELTRLHAVGNAILLIFAAVIDGVAGWVLRLALLREEGTRSNEGSDCERDKCPVHVYLHGPCFVAWGPR